MHLSQPERLKIIQISKIGTQQIMEKLSKHKHFVVFLAHMCKNLARSLTAGQDAPGLV